MSIYEGKQRDNGVGGQDVFKDGQPLSPVPSQRLWNHSPDGFNWGYSGSGPAQLALALLLDVTGDTTRSLGLHQSFKRAFVAGWGAEWQMTSEEIWAWIKGQKGV